VPETLLRARCAWLAERFRYFGDETSDQPRWVVFARVGTDRVSCVPLDDLSVQILSHMADGITLGTVLAKVFGRNASAADPAFVRGLVAVDQLIQRELLEEISHP
jgi:hypothetical protein